jgi:hypothetical protein
VGNAALPKKEDATSDGSAHAMSPHSIIWNAISPTESLQRSSLGCLGSIAKLGRQAADFEGRNPIREDAVAAKPTSSEGFLGTRGINQSDEAGTYSNPDFSIAHPANLAVVWEPLW